MATQSPEPVSVNHDFPIVGIGASAGGISALRQFFANLPADSGMAFVVILHLSQQHESNLAPILQHQTAMPVAQVTEAVKVEPNHVYVIPPAKHLEMVDGVIKLAEPQRIRGRRVPIDLFFRTLADAYGRQALCMVLSGTGSDGTLGLKRVKEQGGIAFVQDPMDAEYDGMPRSAIDTGLVDIVLPAAEMPEKLLALQRIAVKLPEVAEVAEVAEAENAAPEGGYESGFETEHEFDAEAGKEPDSKSEVMTDVLREILTLLRVRTGHDFFNYKRPTLVRRLTRRMQVREIADLPVYLTLLREHPDEVRALLRDLLITVTNFFRDKDAFAALEQDVLPRLFTGKGAGDTVRVWVCGCATGEEAYSIAILLREHAACVSDPPAIQVFASDINEEAIHFARECRYDENIVADVTPERLRQFFTKEGDKYRVKKEIRELVLFAPHNVLRDPPFSRLDLISCRNLLIYLNRGMQARVLELFNFALRRDGFLFLGGVETAENLPALFSTVDKKHRIYRCSAAQAAHPPLPELPITGKWEIRIPELPSASGNRQASYGELHYKLVERYAPPSVLVNEEYDIVHASEHAARFLRFAGGEPSRNLLKVGHPALLLDLRAALFSARQENRESRSPNVRVRLDGDERLINVIVRPANVEAEHGFFLVLFEETGETHETPAVTPSIAEVLAGDKAMEAVVQRLEEELRQAREQLRATIEQSETSTEELKASNEELQAMNEELRSATEELETSKEELQSVNEELVTVNLELKEKVDALSRANSDMQNLMSSTDIATLFLDRALRIKFYTPRVQEILNIIPSDVGRSLDHLTHKLDYENMAEDAAEVLRTLRISEREVRGSGDRHYLLRLAPYRTMEDRIDGVVLSFVDATELTHASEALHELEERFSVIVAQATAGIARTDLDGKFLLVNDRFREITGYSQEELLQMRMQDITHPEDLPRTVNLFERTVTEGAPFVIEKRCIRKDGSPIWIYDSVAAITGAGGKPKFILVVSLDATAQRQTEKALHESEAKFRILSETAPALIWFDDPQGNCLFVNQQYLDFSGKTLDELKGTGWQLVLHPEDADEYIADFLAAQRERRPFHNRARMRRQDGEWRWIESFAQPLLADDGAYLGHVGVSPDITASVEAEEALKDADRRKDEFLATLAHELRNPLAAIHPALEVLRRGDKQKGRAAQEVIERQIGQVVRLVDDLLDISRITEGKVNLQIERVALADAVKSALETTRPIFEAARHDLTISLPGKPLYLDADPVRLMQVFLNLLTNAARYTEPGGKIRLSAECAGDQVIVRIKDDGIGISPDMLPHIFELFVQGRRASQRGQGGLGIGLSLVKRLVEMHGGTVEAHSEGADQGSEFIVRLPLAADQKPASRKRTAAKADARKTTVPSRRVLVVDDNVDSAEMMEVILTKDGHKVKLAYDGETAIQAALEFQPELMFLDIGLPDLSGYEIAARLRPQLPNTLLVALSGWGQENDRRLSKEAGFDHHLVKPFNFNELPALLAEAGGDRTVEKPR